MTSRNDYSHLTGSDNAFIDSLYEDYKKDPTSVEPSWRDFFKGFEYKLDDPNLASGNLDKEFRVYKLIQGYRSRGHLEADTNPVRERKDRKARLELGFYGLEEKDLESEFSAGEFLGLGVTKLSDIVKKLRNLYCGKMGIEYFHSNNSEIREWVREKFETGSDKVDLAPEKRKQTLHKLNQATVFEQFLQTKFIGQKRFSLEGGESTIPGIDALLNTGTDLGVEEFVIGMAHRGRLNILANTLGKSYEFIFHEFQGGDKNAQHTGGGDVKYHLGYSGVHTSLSGKQSHLKLMHNPSHLEAVAPVALGYARAQTDIRYNSDESKICPIIIHGDAALAGQGVCYETLQMAELKAYQTGGAIHFVINNQIGFTTDFEDGRSSHYATSLARTLEAPIIHVNGDSPEHVVYCMEMAMELRQKFKTDIFVDMVCYRKHGHNEGDEPKFTQPHLYGLIAKTKSPRELYIDELSKKGAEYKDLAKSMQDEFKSMLSDRFNNVKEQKMPKPFKGKSTEWLDLRWSEAKDFDSSPDTSVKAKTLDLVLDKMTSTPDNFNLLKKAGKILGDRRKAYEDDKLDWGLCELLAYGSLLLEGNNVRFSGQDVIRGTFSHRHAKVFDEKTNESYCGLSHIADKQGMFEIYNSHLSEYAVLGFEYGYSLASPKSLNIWEAQFGDFSNTAQVIVDQFISAGEMKWERMSGLTMLLPHGYEGQGPEHSSARPERFLQLCAKDNMIVVNVTSPANFFHLLRRQQTWPFRKPLIVFSPKSLLRDPLCISKKNDLTTGSFKEVIDDSYVTKKDVKRVLICTGKVYYDLLREQQEKKAKDIAVIRLEQLYPLPIKELKRVLKSYSNRAEFYWVQEEPENMGQWSYLLSRHPEIFIEVGLISRPLSATPATGFAWAHEKEQADIVKKSFEK